MRAAKYIVVFCITLIVTATAAYAQCEAENASILHARYKEGDTRILVSLSKLVSVADLNASGRAEQWTLDDLSASPSIKIPIKNVKPDTLLNGETTSLILSLEDPLEISHILRLTAPSLTFLGCHQKEDELVEALLQKKKKPQAGAAGQIAQTPAKTNHFPMGKSQGRDDSNVYLSGTIEGARKGNPTFAADIKVEVPYVINTGTQANGTPGTSVDVRPYFNLKASSTKNGNADSMNFGGKFRLSFLNKTTGPVRYLLWEPAVGFESDRRFRNVNLITGQFFTFGLPGNKHTFKRRIRVLPLVGFEFGHNLESPVAAGKGRTIARGAAGASFYLNVDRSEDSSLSFQVDYIRRFLLNREISFTEDDDKKLIPLFLGKGPRDYLKATGEYDFSKFTGFTLSYEHGRLPPNFELVNSKYSLGLVFKFTTKFGSD